MLRAFLNITQRVTFVVDKQGIVRGVFRYELAVENHLRDVKATLASIAA